MVVKIKKPSPRLISSETRDQPGDSIDIEILVLHTIQAGAHVCESLERKREGADRFCGRCSASAGCDGIDPAAILKMIVSVLGKSPVFGGRGKVLSNGGASVANVVLPIRWDWLSQLRAL
jgi:hypothetical protein